MPEVTTVSIEKSPGRQFIRRRAQHELCSIGASDTPGIFPRHQTPTEFGLSTQSGCLVQSAASGENDLFDIVPNFRDATHHLAAQNVTKSGKGFASSFLLLVVSHDQLHKFSGVNVGVSSILDILYDFDRQVGGEPF